MDAQHHLAGEACEHHLWISRTRAISASCGTGGATHLRHADAREGGAPEAGEAVLKDRNGALVMDKEETSIMERHADRPGKGRKERR